MTQTIHSCLLVNGQSPSTALLGVTRRPLTYAGLLQQIEQTVERLNAFGIGRGDTVAVALRNGPEAAAACLSVACGAACAPLNADSIAGEFDRQLSRLNPKAILVEAGSKSACVEVARGRGIPLLWLVPDDPGEFAGRFSLEGGSPGRAAQPGMAHPDDVALRVHTSGSTSQSKLAPLTHRNVCYGAMGNVMQLGLTTQDRCLCVTAMFFTQGLIVSVFSSLLAGGSVVCTPGYDSRGFFAWLDEFHPTWYAAPVSVQRSILINAAKFPDVISRSRLRVIRCSSSTASPDFIAQIEALFRAPMLDSYGLTETSSTIAGERLPPAARKPGSVGLPVGCEIAIVDEQGAALEPGMVGEVTVRSPAVLGAYEAGPDVNQQSFVNGWLRTGDLGSLDRDGFLFLQGRKKELINRGGEKILPAEIDEVLNSHPSVAEGIAFAAPHDMLGEEVAAAIVPRNGWLPSAELERELREFCASRLSVPKVPRKIVFVRDLPKTPTGKTMRIGLAEKLGVQAAASAKGSGQLNRDSPSARENGAIPHDIVEMLLLSLWEDVLNRRPIGMEDDFFELGGDSLEAARLLASVEEVFGVDLGPAGLLVAPTVAGMAASLTRSHVSGRTLEGSKIIAIHSSGSLPPMFILGAQPLYRELILNLSKDQPLYALSLPDMTRLPSPFRLEDVAALQVEALQRFRPEGPYALMGWCADGVLAYEMARQLRARGQQVSLVAMIDSFNPEHRRKESLWQASQARLRFHMANLARLDAKNGLAYCRDRFQTAQVRLRRLRWRLLHGLNLRKDRRNGSGARDSEDALAFVVSRYSPAPYNGSVLVVRAGTRPAGAYADAAHGWQTLIPDLRMVELRGNHRDIFAVPNVALMASAISEAMHAARKNRERSAEAV